MSASADLFEVTAAAASAAARRLTTAAYVGATMSSPPADAVLEAYIDEVSAKVSQICGLANDGTNVPTFAAETCRATYYTASNSRGQKLLLPWRYPISSITSIVEAGVTLTTGTEYRLLPGAMVLRLAGDSETPTCWSQSKIVVVYVGGWSATLSTNAPVDLQAAVAEQVKYRALQISRDPSLRSLDIDELRSETYNVVGGDSIGASGLLIQVENALAPYRNFAI